MLGESCGAHVPAAMFPIVILSGVRAGPALRKPDTDRRAARAPFLRGGVCCRRDNSWPAWVQTNEPAPRDELLVCTPAVGMGKPRCDRRYGPRPWYSWPP